MYQTNQDTDKRNKDIVTENVAYFKDIEALAPYIDKDPVEALALIFVTKGKLTITIDSETVVARSHDLLVCRPHSIFGKYSVSSNFDCSVVALSKDFIYNIISNVRIKWVNIASTRTPLLHLDDNMVRLINNYYHLLGSSIVANTDGYNAMSVRYLTFALLEELKSYALRIGAIPVEQLDENPVRQSDVIFKRFITLASKAMAEETNPSRSIQYYAEMLNVSPKYLTHVCKVCSGDTAKNIIGKMLIKRIETLLIYNDMSIKEIAMQLGFPDVSNFGRYVKAKLGESPRAIRSRARK
ncbi:MAG: helix-turn-helix domain-containing protein [Muribaculaceae bacterium]